LVVGTWANEQNRGTEKHESMDKRQAAYPIKADVKAFSVREKILSFKRAIKPKELEEIMGISQQTISRHVKDGMPCIRFGGSVRFDPRAAGLDIEGEVPGCLRRKRRRPSSCRQRLTRALRLSTLHFGPISWL
jgi:hypothetical protein